MRLRLLICGLAFCGMVQGASAADLGDSFLRGSTVVTAPGGPRWDGFYIGGQVGAVNSGADFGRSTRNLVDAILANSSIGQIARPADWGVLSKVDTSGSSFGGFVGYNTQFDGAIVGFELNYNRTSLAMASAGSMARQPAGFPDTVFINASTSTKITDYGTARVRGGWAAGAFMPYGFVGVAIGRADVARTATVALFDPAVNPLAPYFTDTRSDGKAGDFAYGYTIGLGLDICVWQNLFVRGEYEYVQFGAFNDINLHIHTARVGAGLKF